MSDILLFKIEKNQAIQLNKTMVSSEKNLQELIQSHLYEFFQIDFLATEFVIGKNKRRIDTLGIDENNSPVIIEFKKSMDKGIMEQILAYRAWLMDYKAEFENLVKKKVKDDKSKDDIKVDWTSPRLLCIAEDFTSKLLDAVGQIPTMKIQLIRYQMYENNHIIFELIGVKRTKGRKSDQKAERKRVEIKLKNSSDKIKKLFSSLDFYIKNLGEDVTRKELEIYFAYTKIRNFVCLLIYKDALRLYLKLDPSEINHLPNITRDVTGIGHYGTGDLEITITNENELEQVKTLIEKSYMGG